MKIRTDPCGSGPGSTESQGASCLGVLTPVTRNSKLGSLLLSRGRHVCTPKSSTLTHPVPEGQGLPGMKRLWPRQDRKQFSTPPTLPQDSWAWAEALDRDRHPLISEEKRDTERALVKPEDLVVLAGALNVDQSSLQTSSQGQTIAGSHCRSIWQSGILATDSQLILSPYSPGLGCLKKGHFHPQTEAPES